MIAETDSHPLRNPLSRSTTIGSYRSITLVGALAVSESVPSETIRKLGLETQGKAKNESAKFVLTGTELRRSFQGP
jgi:hypothetical protein